MFDDLLGPKKRTKVLSNDEIDTKVLKDVLEKTEKQVKEQKEYLDKTVAENTK